MRVVGAQAQAAAYAGDGRVVRALSVAPVLDDSTMDWRRKKPEAKEPPTGPPQYEAR